MNDKTIFKAIECCATQSREVKCNNCPAFVDSRCTLKPRDLLEFINRLQAENEELKRALNIKLDDLASEYDNKIKSEARKEFAERLCEGRVSNDPVVIAVKVELEMMDVKVDETS